MAVETEMYLVFPDELLEIHTVCPGVIFTDSDKLQEVLDIVQKASSAAQTSMRVLKVTEAELMYKITPEERPEDEEIDEDLPTGITFGGTKLVWD